MKPSTINQADFSEGSPSGKLSALRLPVLLVALALAWLVMTVLKESSGFWRNSGGYPLGFRSFVHDFYYPAGILLGFFGVLQLRRIFRGGRPARSLLACVLIFWILFAMGSGFLVANNVVNLFEGHALHWHPGDP